MSKFLPQKIDLTEKIRKVLTLCNIELISDHGNFECYCVFYSTLAYKGRYAAQLLNGAITRHATYFKTFLGTSLNYMRSFIKIGGTVLEKNVHKKQRDIHLLLLGYRNLYHFDAFPIVPFWNSFPPHVVCRSWIYKTNKKNCWKRRMNLLLFTLMSL